MIVPSFAQGYAKGPGDSDFPDRWRGSRLLVVPALGVTGSRLDGLTFPKYVHPLVNMGPEDWIAAGDDRIHGHALDFDGLDDYVDIDSRFAYPETTHSFIAWVFKRDDQYLFDCEEDRLVISLGQFGTADNMSYFDGIDWKSVGFVESDVWSHLALTLGPDGGVGYINGVESGTGTYNPREIKINRGKAVCASNLGDSRWLDCKLAYFHMYNRILTAEEVWESYLDYSGLLRLRRRVKVVEGEVEGFRAYRVRQVRRRGRG